MLRKFNIERKELLVEMAKDTVFWEKELQPVHRSIISSFLDWDTVQQIPYVNWGTYSDEVAEYFNQARELWIGYKKMTDGFL